ncbi:MAG TPA: flagellar hook-basal body protein [Anaerovoracaceae bacterium]|nr:flagellar hook-basal body protein [Anaerovoracaceae bacterium]
MIRGFYTATSGLVSQQTNLNVIANNMANSGTTGFKPQHVAFSSLLHERINGGGGHAISVGHGIKTEKTDIDFTQGSLIETGMPYDHAILGEGFFALESIKDGQIFYTRDGSFQVGLEGRRGFLTDAFGNYVLNDRERKIEVGENYDHNQIGIFNFSNPYGLEKIGGGFLPTEISGNAEGIKDPIVKSGYLENSAVQVAKEMVRMIEASKGFSFNSRIIQTADEMERTINQIR